MLGQAGVADNAAIRLARQRKGDALQIDAERPGDSAFQHRGRTVLVLDARVSEFLSSGMLDVDGDRVTLQ